MAQQVDTLFVGGSVFTPGRPSPSAPGSPSRRSDRRSRPDAELRELAGPRTEVVDLAGGLLLPGFQDAHVHPVMGGLAMLQCDLHGTTSAAGVPGRSSRRTPRATPTSSGSSAAAGRWQFFPGGTPTRQALDAVVAGPPGLPDQPGRPRRPGSTRRALELAGIDADDPGPGRRPDRARAGRRTDRHPARGRRRRWSAGCSRAPASRDLLAGLLLAQDLLVLARHHRVAGRRRRGDLRARRHPAPPT